MHEWYVSLPSWLVGIVSVILLTSVTLWGAKDRVRTGAAKTLIGGITIEVVGIIFVSAGVLFVFSTFYPLEGGGKVRLATQYFSASILCLIVGLFCARSARQTEERFNKAAWAAIGIVSLAGYLFYRGLNQV